MEALEKILKLYRNKYKGFNVAHYRDMLKMVSDYESHLIAITDDARGEIYKTKIFDSDSTLNNMSVIKSVIEEKGLFGSLYVDKASMFTTTRHGGTHVNIKEEQNDTQIQRALKSLNITMSNANSPQAKGRVERLFKTFKDRLVKEPKLKKIETMEEANRYIEKVFLPHYNNKFKKEPLSLDSFFLKTTAGLDNIFSVKEERTVDNANCVPLH